MKRLICTVTLLALLLGGCAGAPSQQGPKKYTATFLTLFDTVTTIVGFADSEEAFRETAQQVHDALLVYHQLFDIYHSYDGIVNLKDVNEAEGKAVTVDEKILQLLSDCKEYYDLTDGRVNAAMGSVLKLWHEAREDGCNDPAHAALPEETALQEAANHVSMDAVVLDWAHSTVQITDPDVQLDVGAVAKGWSVQRVAETAPEGLLISVGGNVCATGPKGADGAPWVIGIQNPDDAEDYLHTIYVSAGSVVTSGDYQRTYLVEGKGYHHIIDPETLYPSTLWRSVTIVHPDSGLADALSTALFLLPLEEGQKLAAQCGVEAMWVDTAGEEYVTPGFEELIRN